jgi:hypothetical protein
MGSDYENLVFYSICDTREAGCGAWETTRLSSSQYLMHVRKVLR